MSRHEQVAFHELDLCETTLEAVEFDRCVFQSARFNCAVLTGVVFLNRPVPGSTMVTLDLSGALLHRADLTRCDLRGSDLKALVQRTTELRQAIIMPEQAVVVALAMGMDVRVQPGAMLSQE